MSVIQKDGTVSGDWGRKPRDIEVQEAGLGCIGRGGTEGGDCGPRASRLSNTDAQGHGREAARESCIACCYSGGVAAAGGGLAAKRLSWI